MQKCIFYDSLKIVHEILIDKIKHLKSNSLRSILRSYLYELMPDTNDKRFCLNSIAIDIGNGEIFNFRLVVRKGSKPKRIT